MRKDLIRHCYCTSLLQKKVTEVLSSIMLNVHMGNEIILVKIVPFALILSIFYNYLFETSCSTMKFQQCKWKHTFNQSYETICLCFY